MPGTTALPRKHHGVLAAMHGCCSDPTRFCPDFGLVGGRASQWNLRTAWLLHRRLRALGLFVVAASLMSDSRSFFMDVAIGHTFPRVITGLMIVFVVYLYVAKNPPLIKLRFFEVFVFAGPIASLVYIDHRLILDASVAGDAGVALMNWYRFILHMALAIGAYAIFIPSGWKRTLVVTGAIGAVPFIAGAWMLRAHPEVAAVAQQALTVEILTAGAMLTVMFVGIATYGTFVIDTARHEVAEAGFAGQYKLVKKLGTGGMGEVWLARHAMLARPAAIKIIRPEMLVGGGGAKGADVITMAVKRFEREAQATATLTSPHTIELYDFGTAMDGSFYYVMEYLEGVDLDTLIDDHGPVPVERAVHLLVQAAESLADAHERGLIHRDIKPANIFTTRQGISHDFVKVLDFGLVKEVDREAAATQLTQEGMTSGTPAYMPPEIALGQEDIDGRADLYALGCVGYWLTTGQCVFPGDSPVAMIVEHVKTEPQPPSRRTELPIPPEFDAVILRALAKDPAQRFQSMRELAEALRTVPVEAPWDERRAEEWWQLHAAGMGAAAVAA